MTPSQGALEWAARGFHVFPIKAGSKAPPLIMDFENAATIDRAQIEAWIATYPDCNWGCAPARSGHMVLDLDCKNGKNGLAELERVSCELGVEIPHTLVVETPSGGFHFYLKGLTQSSQGRIAPGIDVRSNGGYVLVPGSVLHD